MRVRYWTRRESLSPREQIRQANRDKDGRAGLDLLQRPATDLADGHDAL